MRKIALVCIISVIIGSLCHSQQSLIYAPKEITGGATLEPEAIPGCRVLRSQEEELARYVQAHPELLLLQKKTGPAWNFNPGDKGPVQGVGWWATNLVTQTEYLVPSTCRAVGTHAYYFVEDSLWNRGRVTQVQVDSIAAAFDFRTPASSQKGVFQFDVETFGNPPDVDNDPKLIILILDIRDSYTGSGSYVAGYFFSLNQFPDGTFSGRRSNYAEIYYLDGDPLPLTTPSGLATGIATTAHEFQHMIHWNYDSNEETFINEGCSMVAEIVCGYAATFQNQYVSNTDVYLLGWQNSLADYGRAQRWVLYLWNQFPNDYLKLLVQNTGRGISGINSALAQYSPATARRFADIFIDWLVANHLNDRSVDSKYGYTYPGALAKPTGTTHVDPNTGQQNGNVTLLAADYITFNFGSNLNITITSASADIRVMAIEVGPFSKRVVPVATNTPFLEPVFGSTYTSITFVVINTSQTFDAPYSYQATGTAQAQAIEIKRDNGAGLGAFGSPPLTPDDTVAVYFNGFQGALLDSIRIAFRRPGSIKVGLWKYPSGTGPSPIGMVLINPVQLTVAPGDTNGPPFPTSEATTKWTKWDISSLNISTNNDFVVAAIVGANVSIPGVMVTKTPDTTGSPDHSFTYLRNPSGGGAAGWYYLTDGAGSLWLYMIRAYAHIPLTGITEVIELLPSSFSLKQNYPNPFNPSTLIEYDLPRDDYVVLKVFDILGREVRTLVDESQRVGRYRADWDGRDNLGRAVGSGVYFYRLHTKNFVQTNKMVLVR